MSSRASTSQASHSSGEASTTTSSSWCQCQANQHKSKPKNKSPSGATCCSGVPLSATSLARNNANPAAVERQWVAEEEKRIQRVQQAARELGFELPRRWI